MNYHKLKQNKFNKLRTMSEMESHFIIFPVVSYFRPFFIVLLFLTVRYENGHSL